MNIGKIGIRLDDNTEGRSNEAGDGMTAFQEYLMQTYGAIDIDGKTVERKVELAEALDALLAAGNYEYRFDESEFRFAFIAKYPGVDFVPFSVDFIVSPPNIAVIVCPLLESLCDLSSGNIDAAKEVVNEFRNELGTGLFEVSDENAFTYFAYTDWYGGRDDVPDKRFMHYLLTKPMSIWLTYLNTVLKAVEGSVDIEAAKMEIREIRERNRRE